MLKFYDLFTRHCLRRHLPHWLLADCVRALERINWCLLTILKFHGDVLLRTGPLVDYIDLRYSGTCFRSAKYFTRRINRHVQLVRFRSQSIGRELPSTHIRIYHFNHAHFSCPRTFFIFSFTTVSMVCLPSAAPHSFSSPARGASNGRGRDYADRSPPH